MKFPKVDLTGLKFSKKLLERAKTRLVEKYAYHVCLALTDGDGLTAEELAEARTLASRIMAVIAPRGTVRHWMQMHSGFYGETVQYRLLWVDHMLKELENDTNTP